MLPTSGPAGHGSGADSAVVSPVGLHRSQIVILNIFGW